MAKVLDRDQAAALYEQDFPAWARLQAKLLEGRRFEELDLAHLIREMDDLALNARQAVLSRTRRILQHFLELEFSPVTWPRRGWRETVVSQRSDLEEILTQSLRNDLNAAFDGVWRRARRDALKDLEQDGLGTGDLPTACPYTLDQVLDPGWLPVSVHGIDDHPANAAE